MATWITESWLSPVLEINGWVNLSLSLKLSNKSDFSSSCLWSSQGIAEVTMSFTTLFTGGCKCSADTEALSPPHCLYVAHLTPASAHRGSIYRVKSVASVWGLLPSEFGWAWWNRDNMDRERKHINLSSIRSEAELQKPGCIWNVWVYQDTYKKVGREHMKLHEARRKRKWWGGHMYFLTLDILILFKFYNRGLLLKLTEAIKVINSCSYSAWSSSAKEGRKGEDIMTAKLCLQSLLYVY